MLSALTEVLMSSAKQKSAARRNIKVSALQARRVGGDAEASAD